jgi:hypothetical protein
MAKWSVLSWMLHTPETARTDLLERFDQVVYEVALATLDALERDPQVDLFALTDELKAHTASRLADLPALPASPYQRRQPLLCAD